MILLRLEGLEGKYCDITGGREDEYFYSSGQGGWFPIESMTFNIAADAKKRKKGTRGSGQGGGADRQATSGGSGGDAADEKEDNASRISVSKKVDMASTSLMRFAMEDRKLSKGESTMRKADIHFLHSVMEGTSQKTLTTIFPYLMITLEDVAVASWNISAGADDRPSETLELKYDKAAMRYYRTKDGKTWVGGDVAGWDQHGDVPWVSSSPYFSEPKCR